MVIMQLSDLKKRRARLAGARRPRRLEGRPARCGGHAPAPEGRRWRDLVARLDGPAEELEVGWPGVGEARRHRHGDRAQQRSDRCSARSRGDREPMGRRVRRSRIGRTHALDLDTSISFVKSERPEDEGVCRHRSRGGRPRARRRDLVDLRHRREPRLMRYGVAIPTRRIRFASASALNRMAAVVEDLGFDSIWTSDHIIVPEGSSYIPEVMLEPLAGAQSSRGTHEPCHPRRERARRPVPRPGVHREVPLEPRRHQRRPARARRRASGGSSRSSRHSALRTRNGPRRPTSTSQ